MKHPDDRIFEALQIVEQYGGIDGAHHKQWVLDQVVRVLLGPEHYGPWVARMNDGDYVPWDEGIAP